MLADCMADELINTISHRRCTQRCLSCFFVEGGQKPIWPSACPVSPGRLWTRKIKFSARPGSRSRVTGPNVSASTSRQAVHKIFLCLSSSVSTFFLRSQDPFCFELLFDVPFTCACLLQACAANTATGCSCPLKARPSDLPPFPPQEPAPMAWRQMVQR